MQTLSFENTAGFAPTPLPATTPAGMRELSMDEIDHVSGGNPVLAGVILGILIGKIVDNLTD